MNEYCLQSVNSIGIFGSICGDGVGGGGGGVIVGKDAGVLVSSSISSAPIPKTGRGGIVGVIVGVSVGTAVAVGDGDGVAVCVGDDVAVLVGTKVGVRVAVAVHVRVGDGIWVAG